MFRRIGAAAASNARAYQRALQMTNARTRTLLLGGSSATFAISFFAAKEAPQAPEVKVPSYEKNYDRIIAEADALYDGYLIDNAYSILRKCASSRNPELLWRLGRVLCEKAKLTKDSNEKKTLMYEAFAILEKALENEEKPSFGAHKWYAILLDYIGELEGNKSRIEKSYKVRDHLEKALNINQFDATTWYILGMWHFAFADMPGYTRMIAKTIFGTPPSSTYEEALRHFEKAELIQPNFYSKNTFAIAEVYERLGNKEKAVEYYKRAFKMAVISADDRDVHTKAHSKLGKFGIKDSQLV
ncbi:unnamed protein product, partial [Mesorhabditis spiculigera]